MTGSVMQSSGPSNAGFAGAALDDTQPARRQTFTSLQAARGIAAMLVVLYHVGVIMAQPEYGGRSAPFGGVPFGWIGVNFFFVLSGFIILHAHLADIGQPHRLGRYAWRRFARVYPIYWILLTAFIAAAVMGIGHPDFSYAPANLITAYTLVQFERLPTLPLKVAWTLLYEVQFYALFGLAILNRKVGLVVLIGWIVVIVASGFNHHTGDSGLPHIWSLNFLCGGLAYAAYTRLDGRTGAFLLLGGLGALVFLVAGGFIPPGSDTAQNIPMLMLALGVAFALVLAGAALVERHGGLFVPSILSLLGDASYSIYLVHSALVSVLAQAAHALIAPTVSSGILFILFAAIATTGGVVVHLLLERPLIQVLSRKAPPVRTRRT